MKPLSKAPRTSNINWLFYKDYFKDDDEKYLFRSGRETEEIIAKKRCNNWYNHKNLCYKGGCC